jgi:XFP N-terminal domain
MNQTQTNEATTPDTGVKAPASKLGSIKGSASEAAETTLLSVDLLEEMDAWWRAANYLNIGQIYLMANPLLREPLKKEHIKPRLLGALGHLAWFESCLCPSEPSDQAARPQCSVYGWSWPRWSGSGS